MPTRLRFRVHPGLFVLLLPFAGSDLAYGGVLSHFELVRPSDPYFRGAVFHAVAHLAAMRSPGWCGAADRKMVVSVTAVSKHVLVHTDDGKVSAIIDNAHMRTHT